MTKPAKHTRVLVLPYINSLLDARLVSFHEEIYGKRRDFVVDYLELCPLEPVQLSSENGRIVEWVNGNYTPRRLRFYGVRSLVSGMISANTTFAPSRLRPLDRPIPSPTTGTNTALHSNWPMQYSFFFTL